MTLPKCEYRRYTTQPGIEQLHCFLKKDNCSEAECEKCPCIISIQSPECLRLRKDYSWAPNQPSRGFGDTVAKVTHAIGIAQTVQFVSAALDMDCGCVKRQELLNKLFPY